ncbi:helix-turn-helix transcriptional regulator [Microbacterium sp. GXF7504]
MIRQSDLPPRALIVGTAGSGKTGLLHLLRHNLAATGAKVHSVTADSPLDALSPDGVVIVDDAHLLADEHLAAVSRRVESGRGIIVACRPWPRSDRLRAIAGRLEHEQPAIVLGNASPQDVREHLDRRDIVLPDGCITDIVEACGGITWLVREALDAHPPGPGCDDTGHALLQRVLHEVIAERLSAIDPDTAQHVRRRSLALITPPPDETVEDAENLAGYAEGLLQRNGRAVPVVRSAVLSTTPPERIVALIGEDPGRAVGEILEHLSGVTDERIARALLRLGDQQLERDPARAAELYRSAEESGAEPATVRIRRARAAWAVGDIEAAARLLDQAAVPSEHESYPAAVDLAGAVWAARGLMEMSNAAFRAGRVREPEQATHAAMAALGAGDIESALEWNRVTGEIGFPSNTAVSMQLLSRGLHATFRTDDPSGMDDLVRGSLTYTESGAQGPVPELPAVIATIAAIDAGELEVASSTLLHALRGGHGGQWARPRLLLWSAWVALLRQRPGEAKARLGHVQSLPVQLSGRNRLLRDAVLISLVRRYGDNSALPDLWRRCRDDVIRVQPDLYSLHPFGEFIMASSLVGDTGHLEPALRSCIALLERLDNPPAWSTPTLWAGLQMEMLRARPQALAPYARALVAASPHSRVAAAMSTAGRVWTDVLAGSVDADRVEHAAQSLTNVGRAWDGARLASHAAAHTADRRVIARLLALARQLHPQQEHDETPQTQPRRGTTVLTAREAEVAALVVQGKTYVEIGEAIYISPRTAEHHIARIRRRLGATSRSDLIGKLRAILEEGEHDPETVGELDATPPLPPAPTP